MGLPKTFMGLDCQKSLDKILKQKEVDSKPRAVVQQLFDKAKYIYVPSIDLYVSKEIEYKNNNWVNCHKLLSQNNQRMLTLSDFIEFLKYCKTDYPKIYNSVIDITDNIGRCEWLDAYFSNESKTFIYDLDAEGKSFSKGNDNQVKLKINYNHVFDSKGDLVPANSELINDDTSMEDFSISIKSYISKNYTSQGLPTSSVKQGSMNYSHPSLDCSPIFIVRGSLALSCNIKPNCAHKSRGVRPCFRLKAK